MRVVICLLCYLSVVYQLTAQDSTKVYYLEFVKKGKPNQLRIMADGEEVVCKIKQVGRKKLRMRGNLNILNDSTLQIGNQVFHLRQIIYITARTDWWDRKLSALLMTAGGLAAAVYGAANIGMNRPVPANTGIPGIVHTLAVTTGVTLAAAGTMQFVLPGKYFFYNKYWKAKIKPLQFTTP
ncbi:MAG: hypothetical protein RMJ87_13860 [Cytophagales bacterium]|nr:hypothetical protein [Bernardetiaceae bacterium]MDW8206109.1 hypothetical protein [Cytophagales bacterium]